MWWMAILKKKFPNWNIIGDYNACLMAIIVDMYASAWTTWTSIGINSITVPKANEITSWINEMDKNMLNEKQLHASNFSFKNEEAIILE